MTLVDSTPMWVFRAGIDALVVFSACPQDMPPINSGTPTEAHFEVLDQ